MQQTNDMSDTDDSDEIIKNEDTRIRRAWIDWAVETARRRIERDAALSEPTEEPARPQLRVVPSRRQT